ncbi:MAG: cyclic nucleotide-binding/CBS domain-containing protein [Candidatus Binatia bacterium]
MDRESQKTVAGWMHRGIISCHPEASIEEVAKIMDSKEISALVVIKEGGEAVGVISRTDLVNARFVQPYLKHWRGLVAAHLMTTPVISVTPDTSITEAARLLQEKRIHRLVVMEQGDEHPRPVGILSVTDLSKHVDER